jgi:phospholipid/cholesterol/gamma-HCH transport system substrate-binding protein
MEGKREQVFVGLFVVIATALLVITVFTLSGALASSTRTFHAKFRNVAGLEPGATVRYEGGPKIGRVEKLKIDPADPALMDMEFDVKSDLPIKTDSHVAPWETITSKLKRARLALSGLRMARSCRPTRMSVSMT